MKAINFKQLATFSFAALLLASCSDSNNEAGNADANAGKATTIVGSAVTSITDAQTLAARVSNLKITSTSTNARTYSATRATRSTTTPKQPTVPTDAKNITEVLNDKPWDAHPGNYYVDSDVNNSKINIKGMNIYIKNGGTFVHNSEDAWDFNTHIYVLNGGKLIARNEDKVFSCNKVDNWGTIEFPTSQNTYLIQNTFNNYGDLNVSDKTLQIESNTGNVAVYGNLVAKDIKLNSNAPTLNCTGDVTVEKIYLTNSSTATINETLTTTGTGGNVDDKNGCAIYLDSNSKLVANCAVKSHNIYVTNGSTIKTRYIKAQNYFQDSNAKVQLQNQSLFDIADTYNNQNNGEGSINLGEEGVAVIKCKKVQYNSSGDPAQVNNCKIFTTSGNNAHIIIDATDGIYNNSNNKIEVNFDGAGNVYLASSTNAKQFSIKATMCNGGGWNDNSGTGDGGNTGDNTGGNTGDNTGDSGNTGGSSKSDTTPKGTLDLINNIDYNNESADGHTHEISATGIQDLNGKFYMSYHTNQEQSDNADYSHGGCVEVFSRTGDKITMEQYLYDSARDVDFNHLLAVKKNNGERMIYLPGSSNKKGAMLAYMKIQDGGLIATESKEIATGTTGADGKKEVTYQQPLNFIQLHPATAEYARKGYDENCVVYNDQTNHLIVATTEGYMVYDADSYNEVGSYPKPGKAKHFAIGNGKIVGLYLNNRIERTDANKDEDLSVLPIPATIEIIDRNTEDFNNTKTFNVTVDIEPNDGKNVVAVKDNKIYVCTGAQGLYCYDMNGNEQWHYQMPNPKNQKGKWKALCNGCFVDDNYVYIAYGSYGIVVLDKNNPEKVVAHRAVSKSANYITVKDDYIYVAYGRDRLQVFKLYANGLDSSKTQY